MHRQSLGSPASKLHANGVLILQETSSELLLSPQKKPTKSNDDDEKQKNKKPHKTTPSGRPHPEKFIHLIPILTLLCIFVLYLNSHDPSLNDLAQFNGFKALSKTIDTKMEIEKSEIVVIQSMRNLRGVDKEISGRYRRINRKIGDF